MTAPDLLPCPFCGCNLVWSEDYREFCHPLEKCMLTGMAFSDTAEKVIASWNTRATPDPAAIREAALREAADVKIDTAHWHEKLGMPWQWREAILALIQKEPEK